MDLSYPPPLLAGAMLLGIAPVAAVAQERDRDAAGYPCAAGPTLAVVESDSGFAITSKAARPAPVATPTMVRVGRSLTIDSRIFARTSLVGPESSHVPQR